MNLRRAVDLTNKEAKEVYLDELRSSVHQDKAIVVATTPASSPPSLPGALVAPAATPGLGPISVNPEPHHQHGGMHCSLAHASGHININAILFAEALEEFCMYFLAERPRMEATSKAECDVEKKKENATAAAIRSMKVCTDDDILDGAVLFHVLFLPFWHSFLLVLLF